RAHRLQHGIESLPHGLDPPRRRAWQRRRTRRLENLECPRRGILDLVEDGALGIVRLDCLHNALDRPVGQAGGLPAAEVGLDASAAGGAPSVATASIAATIAARRFGRGIGVAIAERVSAEYALVDVVVGVGPERVIRVGIEGVIDEVVVGIRPEQRAYPPDHDRVRKSPGGAEAAPAGPGCPRFFCWLACATVAPPRPPRPLTCGCCG